MDKVIWMLWFQGLDNAPVLVQKCVESWKRQNADWKIIFLDETNLKHYVDIDPILSRNGRYISFQGRANLVRLKLLTQYGGVWADATCFCMQPLSNWLPEMMSSGFFAFQNPGPDRLMSNWFLASEKDCYLTQKLFDEVYKYWMNNDFSGMTRRRHLRIRRILQRYSNSSVQRTGIWFTWFVLQCLNVFPLFWFHYLFAKLIKTDREFARIWKSTPYRSAVPLLSLQKSGQALPATAEILDRISRAVEPMHKLSWKKAAKEGFQNDSVLDFLLRSR